MELPHIQHFMYDPDTIENPTDVLHFMLCMDGWTYSVVRKSHTYKGFFVLGLC